MLHAYWTCNWVCVGHLGAFLQVVGLARLDCLDGGWHLGGCQRQLYVEGAEAGDDVHRVDQLHIGLQTHSPGTD